MRSFRLKLVPVLLASTCGFTLLSHASASSGNYQYVTDIYNVSEHNYSSIIDDNFIDARGLCNLCQDGLKSLNFPHAIIKSDGTRCKDMAMMMPIYLDTESIECQEHKEAWRQICCGDDEPPPVNITEILDKFPDPDDVINTGPFAKCHLCNNQNYPGSDSMVIHLLYIGPGSCPQYWELGQKGQIPPHLCDPLQYYADDPCDCAHDHIYDDDQYDDDKWDGGTGGGSGGGDSDGDGSGGSEGDDDEEEDGGIVAGCFNFAFDLLRRWGLWGIGGLQLEWPW